MSNGLGKFLAVVVMLCLAAAGTLLAAAAHAADIKGSADHELVPRYEDSEIVAYDAQAYTQKTFARSAVKQGGGLQKNPDAALELEGKLVSITYRAPEDRSALEVARNYQVALEEGGFTEIYSCSRAECGGRNFNHAVSPRNYYMGFGEYHADQQYTLARLQRAEGDVYAGVYVVLNKAGGGPDRNRSMVQVDVMELKPMENRMAVLKADEMNNDLANEGRVVLYGILFDLDKETMRPDSKPQLEEIAKLLKDAPELKVLIVGHTDAQGSLEYNRDLSMRRARSVAKALAAEYGIAVDRLTAEGVGMASPVASNRNEAGRAKNRRVEIVDLGK